MLTTMQPEFSPHDGNPSNDGEVSRVSSSSSASSFDPFLDLDDNENDILDTSIPKYEENTPISPISVVKSAAEWSMISDTPEWSINGLSPKQSPPIQTMGRPGADYDPNRIPSSIFASKAASPMDWSVASNESLFSIGMGNNSFKSGELTPVIEVAGENHGRSDSMWEDSMVNKAEDEKTKMVVMKETTVDHSKESVARTDGVRNCASPPRLSCASGNSNKSFAFPVFTREGGRSGSVRVAPDVLLSKPPVTPLSQSQSQTQAQAVCPKPAETRWFSCFSCCPHCC